VNQGRGDTIPFQVLGRKTRLRLFRVSSTLVSSILDIHTRDRDCSIYFFARCSVRTGIERRIQRSPESLKFVKVSLMERQEDVRSY
jgi:hypothetical protein